MYASGSPHYGRFGFPGLAALIDRLQAVASRFVDGKAFTAYLATTQGTYYGLTLPEALDTYGPLAAGVTSFSAAVSHPNGRVVRVHVCFHPGSLGPQGQFILAGASPRVLQAMAATLRGEAPSKVLLSPTPPPQVPPQELYRPPRQARSLTPPRPRHYDRPTLTLSDCFFFDPETSPDQLIDLINVLSERFLHRQPFHIRLETTDGDYHLHLDRAALHFMFHQRRDKLLMLYMDAATLDGQWVNLRFSYHPLSGGPNAEVDLTSHLADDILSLIQSRIGCAPPLSLLPERLHAGFTFDPAAFDLGLVMGVVHRLSRHHLQRIPPVAFLSTRSGASYTGLSLYQLGHLFPRHRHELAILSFGITQIGTGQTFSLMFAFAEGNTAAEGTLSVMWGDASIHEALRADLWQHLPLAPRQPLTRPHPRLHSGLVSLPWEAPWAADLWDELRRMLQAEDIEALTARALHAHQRWDSTMVALTSADFLLADLSFKHPEVLYQLGIAQAQGLPVLLLAQDRHVIPAEFRDMPQLRYELSPAGIQRLARDLPAAMRRLT
ncbi:MAG: hypothetical protein D6722_07020 [Bacteroidetes bacterium]|nr:MAG: hypothetical protein D6722_07020 [Bacteroidota bacterium]